MLEILYQDAYYVAVNKPSGMLVHRSPIDSRERRFLLQDLRDQLDLPVYPMHRLDKPTSGVLLFALAPEYARQLAPAFENREIHKSYLAVVRGFFEGSGTIDYALRKEIDAYTRRQKAGIQNAVTRYRSLGQAELPIALGRYKSARYSLMRLDPLTGRKHQLRRHMAHCRHPVVGDTRHGDGRHNRFFREHFGIHRLLLHAAWLEFEHPFLERRISVRAPMDDEFTRVLQELGLHHLVSDGNVREKTEP